MGSCHIWGVWGGAAAWTGSYHRALHLHLSQETAAEEQMVGRVLDML